VHQSDIKALMLQKSELELSFAVVTSELGFGYSSKVSTKAVWANA